MGRSSSTPAIPSCPDHTLVFPVSVPRRHQSVWCFTVVQDRSTYPAPDRPYGATQSITHVYGSVPVGTPEGDPRPLPDRSSPLSPDPPIPCRIRRQTTHWNPFPELEEPGVKGTDSFSYRDRKGCTNPNTTPTPLLLEFPDPRSVQRLSYIILLLGQESDSTTRTERRPFKIPVLIRSSTPTFPSSSTASPGLSVRPRPQGVPTHLYQDVPRIHSSFYLQLFTEYCIGEEPLNLS